MLMSCKDKNAPRTDEDNSNMMTQESENLTILQSTTGNLSFRFSTPLMERYDQAKEPYTEFRKGINIIRYDSTQREESSLTANYAIRYENQELWEAKGNVIGRNAAGQQLETEQLFWDQKAKRVYSNVDSKVTQENGDVVFGDGFESDEEFKEWVIRKPKGKVSVNVEPGDSTAANNTAADSVTQKKPEKSQEEPVPASYPVIREGQPVARPQTDEQKKQRKAVAPAKTITPRKADEE